jgi:hypothetical protein
MRKSRTDLRTLCRIQAAGIFSRRLVRDRAHHLAADQPESAEPCVFAPTSQGRAGLSLADLATEEVLAGRAAISGGAQRSAVRTVFLELKNVFEPMLLGPAAVPTRIPAQASSIVLPPTMLFVTGRQLLST